MISVLLNSGSKKELAYMEKYSRHLSGSISEEYWDFHAFTDMNEVIRFLSDLPILDIACVDLTLNGGIDSAKKIRTLNGNTYIMVIADKDISPMEYISPEVMAASLLLRPFDGAALQDVMKKTVKAYFKNFIDKDKTDDVFVIENRDGRQLVPYDRIVCFEARDKKIFAVTESLEYSFYDTIENLEAELPDYFIRSHRGFIVNSQKISTIHLSQSIIVMDDGSELPLSRSFKSSFKEFK